MSLEATLARLAVPPPAVDPASLGAEGTEEVDALMIQLATGERLDRCGAMVVEHLASGGKRLRARLALAASRLLGVGRQGAVAWAAACELLHNASLVHDDVQDGDRTRRGAPTTWVRHGVAQAINAGDLMLVLPGLAVGHVPTDDATRWRLARALADYAARTVRGQSLEMSLLSLDRFGWSDYEAAAGGKTAGLFALPVFGAALLAGRCPEGAATIAGEFERVGLVFQIQDDVLDLFGDKGHRLGSDIREGRVTALVVEHLRLYPEDKPWLVDILRRPADRTEDAVVAEVGRRFRFGGALEEVLERIYALSRQTLHSPVLRTEPGLDEVAHALLRRTLDPIRHLDASLPIGVG